jgi:hypothetical protein
MPTQNRDLQNKRAIINRRKMLIALTAAVALIGMAFIALPFVQSLKPNSVNDAKLEAVDISHLKGGEYQLVKNPLYGNIPGSTYALYTLIYKSYAGVVMAWDVPANSEGVGMPDVHWHSPFFTCRHFGPGLVDGKVDESLPISCHDENIPSEFWKEHWRWDIRGRCITISCENMPVTNGMTILNQFVFGKHTK